VSVDGVFQHDGAIPLVDDRASHHALVEVFAVQA
jgi:hypothetical protein